MEVSPINKILEKFEIELNIINRNEGDPLVVIEKAIGICAFALLELREIVTNDGFKSQPEEVHFFKTIKPEVYSKFIFYTKLFKIKCKCPVGTNKSVVKYLNETIESLGQFFNDNLEFYQYYKSKQDFLDIKYFTRGCEVFPPNISNFHFLVDDKFFTYHDHTLSTIMAHEMLIEYLKVEMEELNNINISDHDLAAILNSGIYWTGSKASLIELIYALDSCGAINKGQSVIKKLTNLFEKIFRIDLSGYYRKYLEIRSRKTDRTKFLDQLKKALLKRMDDAEK